MYVHYTTKTIKRTTTTKTTVITDVSADVAGVAEVKARVTGSTTTSDQQRLKTRNFY
ncbi:hypothetical protein ACFQIA_16565 [Halalkalicoccus sp. GCM10025704]